MFTRSEFSTLVSSAPPLGVSIFLPTHLVGSEIRQGPIRLKNLAAEARDRLVSLGLGQAEAEAFLAPAAVLVEDHAFWQHQSQGLALFLGGEQPRCYRLPIPLAESVAVGSGFQVKPLLPLLAADGSFLVLTLTASKVGLFEASRFALAADEAAGLPQGIGDLPGEPDYENPVQASPVARPSTAPVDASNAQVYGDSPAEWKKNRRVDLVHKVATALEDRVAAKPLPVVLVADTEMAGHFRKLTTLGSRLVGVADVNPQSLDRSQLHETAYAIMRPYLDQDRKEAGERFQALSASHDPRAASDVEQVVRAAYDGRIDTLLLAEGEAVWGGYDQATDEVTTSPDFATRSEDLLEAAAVQTLQHAGSVHLMPHDQTLDHGPAAAILRY